MATLGTGHETVNFPEREFTDKSGTRRYAKIVEFGDTATFNRFCNAAVAAIHEFENKAAGHDHAQ
jgi:hypothetical protein